MHLVQFHMYVAAALEQYSITTEILSWLCKGYLDIFGIVLYDSYNGDDAAVSLLEEVIEPVDILADILQTFVTKIWNRVRLFSRLIMNFYCLKWNQRTETIVNHPRHLFLNCDLQDQQSLIWIDINSILADNDLSVIDHYRLIILANQYTVYRVGSGR